MIIKLGEKKEKAAKSFVDNSIITRGDLNKILEWQKEENYVLDINRIDSKHGDNGVCGK